MVKERVTDGTRIAQLLASEIDGREDGGLSRLAVVDAVEGVSGSPHGEFAYVIERQGETVAEVFVHDDRARIDFHEGLDVAARRGSDAGLRVRPKATKPPRILVFVESGAAVKRAVDVTVDALSSAE